MKKLYPLGKVMLSMILYLSFSLSLQAQNNKVTGTVIDDAGESLPGVNVIIKGTSQGTVTGIEGEYSIDVPGPETVLVFSSVGFVQEEVTVGNQSVIDLALTPDITALEEIVVIGYGTQKKTDLTGSVSTIDPNDLVGQPNARIDQILQGRATGVQVTQTSGKPGAGTVIRVRGGNSIVGNNEPLWVIDGIIVGQNYDLNNINSNDIKSIEILKDASSLAIYGSRGANGVILVTTKGGRIVAGGKPEVKVDISGGMQSALDQPEFLNSQQHVAYANEDALRRGTSLPFPETSNLPETDWYDLLMQDAKIIVANASVAGGSENGNVNYYVSSNYFNQDGIVIGSGIEKFIFRSNIDIQLSEKWKAGIRLNYARHKRNNGTVGYGKAISSLPEIGIYNPDGTYTGEHPISGSPWGNPIANSTLNTNETMTNNFLSTLYLEYRPSEKWVIRSTFNPEINNVKTNKFNSSQRPDYLFVGEKGDASVKTLSSLGWNNENTVQYQSDIGENHSLTVLGGASFQMYKAETSLAEAYGFSNDATGFNNLALGSDPTRNVVGSGYDAFQTVSFFGRVNYAFKDKYLLTAVGRSDGSSRFAQGNKYQFFPSVAAAWKITEESFMQNQSIFEDLKLRASYGKSGSQAIESYRTLALMDDASTSYNGVQFPGVTLGRPANESLKWETTHQFDLALEASLFAGRIFTELNYYQKKTSDLLLNVLISSQTGFTSQLQNLGEIENKGLEFLINSVNVTNDNFSWSTTLTISGNRNKVLDLGGVDFIDIIRSNSQSGADGRLIVGETTPVFVGVDYLGTWKSQEEIDNSGQAGNINNVVGGPHFHDTNGDGNLGSDDFYVIGSPEPDFIYGFENTFSYKKFDFSFFIQGTQGNEVFNSLTLTRFFGRGEAHKYAEVVNRWTPENPNSDIPGAGTMTALSAIPNNSEFIEDASHLRLKSARLAYNFPVEKMGWKSVKNLSIYASGSNLLLLSDFRLIDPETSRFGNDNIAQGYSNGEYPTPRIYTLGLNVTF